MNELKLIRRLYLDLENIMSINEDTINQLINEVQDNSITTFEKPLSDEDIHKYLIEKTKELLNEEHKFDEQICIDISEIVYNAFFTNDYGKYKNDYIFFTADEKEVELYLNGDTKNLYKYATDNDISWIVFVQDPQSMEEIEEAIFLFSTM